MTGRKARAEKEFREVLSHLGEDFSASLYLGRLALEAGDLPGALRETSAARRHSPVRFARFRATLESSSHQSLDRSREEEERVYEERVCEEEACDADRRLTEAGRQARPGRTSTGGEPLPQSYYWEATPEFFDFEDDRVGSDENDDEKDDGLRDEHDLESPWTDFLSHHYFFDSLASNLPLGRSSADGPSGEGASGGDKEENGDAEDFDFLEEDPLGLLSDFLSEEEGEALSPWSDTFSSEDYQVEEDQDERDKNCRSPLAGFYEELEEARKQADGDTQEQGSKPAQGHERFQGLPPIQESEVDAVDWDDLLDRLTEEDGDVS